MPTIEGFSVKNYGVLKDIVMGRVISDTSQKPLTQLVTVIGKNGTGKSTLIDAFGFLADCLKSGVEEACYSNDRRGFQNLLSKGAGDSIEFEITYRESNNSRPITYNLVIAADDMGRPYIQHERLRQRRKGEKRGWPYSFLNITNGRGNAWAGDMLEGDEGATTTPIQLSDLNMPAITTLGALKEHPRITQFRNFIQGWYLCYLIPNDARDLPLAGPQKHLNKTGSNLSNVLQYMEQIKGKKHLQSILDGITKRVPGITNIYTERTADNRLLLCFDEKGFSEPHYVQKMSDGTIKLVAYLVLLEDPELAPLICIEEPENGLYHNLLTILAEELKDKVDSPKSRSQMFITTHSPYFVNALSPEEVWILEKQDNGFSTIKRASDIELVKNLAQEIPLGDLWYSDYLERR